MTDQRRANATFDSGLGAGGRTGLLRRAADASWLLGIACPAFVILSTGLHVLLNPVFGPVIDVRDAVVATVWSLASVTVDLLLVILVAAAVASRIGLMIDRRASTRAAARSQYTLDGFLAATSDLHVQATLDGRFAEVSRSWELLLGEPREKLIDAKFNEWVHPDDHEKTDEVMSVLDSGGVVSGFRNRYLTSDGSYRTLQWNAAIVDGLVYATARDVTEEVEYAERLRQLTDQLEEAQELGNVGSWSFHIDSGGVAWSRQLYRIFQRDPELGPPDYEEAIAYYADDDGERLKALVADAARHGMPYCLNMRIRDPDNPVRWVRAEGRSRRDASGRVSALFGTAMDVTAEIEREIELTAARKSAEAGLKSKSAFLANMSHEIRTPLTAILGFTDLLERGEAPDDAIATIRRNGEHLLTIINDVLDMSKIDAGMMTVESVATDPLGIINEVVDMTRARAERADVAVTLEQDTVLPSTVLTDPTRLRQIALNIVGNAIKFTEAGSITITIGHVVDDGGRLRVRVRDTGIGMSPDQLEAVLKFDAFAQADNSMTRRYGGSGLGLRISNDLSKLLGGSLSAESEIGVGSTFTLEVAAPLADAADAPVAPLADRQPAGPAPLDGTRVLLAEDGIDNQRLISFHLRRCGATVEIADNGRIAADRVMADPSAFDLIVMDMQMPELDGYAATRALRQAGIGLPIVAVTAHAMTGDRERCLAAGCDDYLTKPVEPGTLQAVCGRWIGGRDAG